MTGLPPLATPDDLMARLGRPLTEMETTKAPPLLRDASAQIRRYCRRDFLMHSHETQILYGVDSEIELERPVTSVDSVTAVGSPGQGLPDVPITWFTFDGISKIRFDQQYGIINLPEIWWECSDLYPNTYRVQYSWGYSVAPDEVIAVCANAVIAVMTAPTLAAGVQRETIGPYSYALERGGSGIVVALTQADLQGLSDFRTKYRTVELRLR